MIILSSPSFYKYFCFKERIEDLKTAVAEACLNAMEHGNRDHPDSRVVITMYLGDKDFKVSVMDEGDGMSNIPQHIDIKRKGLNQARRKECWRAH